jgi:hypothetical protein
MTAVSMDKLIPRVTISGRKKFNKNAAVNIA